MSADASTPVRCTDGMDDCKRRYEAAQKAERELRERINALRRELTTAARTRAVRAREYEAAKSSIAELCNSPEAARPPGEKGNESR